MKFIVIEGLDGSGKSTQARILAQKLETMGLPHLSTRQPSDNAIGKVMRNATDAFLPLENEAMALLVAADRYQHVHEVITPALESGKYVICDRYYYSSFAFQGIDPGAFARVAAYNGLVMAYAKPDITFFIDLSPEECMNRIEEGREMGYGGLYDTVAQQTTIRERYMDIFSQLEHSEKIIFINGSQNKTAIADEIWRHLAL